MVWGCFSEFGLGALSLVKGSRQEVLSTLWQQFGYKDILFLSLVWRNLTGMHTALISAPSSTVGKNWNENCEPDFLVQQQCLNKWKQILTKALQNLMESLPRRVAAVMAAKGDQQSY